MYASDTRDKISVVEDGIKDVPCDQIAALVIYDLPGRDCAAKASNGELAVGEINIYKTQYIDRKSSPPSFQPWDNSPTNIQSQPSLPFSKSTPTQPLHWSLNPTRCPTSSPTATSRHARTRHLGTARASPMRSSSSTSPTSPCTLTRATAAG